MMKFIVRRPRDDVNERTVAEDKIEMTAAESHGDAAGESQPNPRAEMVDQSPDEASGGAPVVAQRVLNVDEIDTSAITGLRAITALQIACGHWLLFYGNSESPYLDFQGGVAVSIFFLITGFVMYMRITRK
jgi:hypothetical protein